MVETYTKRFDDSTNISDYIHPLRRSTDRVLQQAKVFIDSLEVIGEGVILVNSDLSISFISQAAKVILAKVSNQMKISDDDGRFSIVGKKNQDKVENLLKKIRNSTQAISITEIIVIDRGKETKKPLVLSLCPLSISGEEPRLMILFRDPETEPTPQWKIFTDYFRLSAQEAKLSLALADGSSINEYSENFHISQHTARTHLKSIFAKTSTRRQADLIRLIFTFTRL